MPLALYPPNGTRGSRMDQALIHTVPARSREATRWARATFPEHTVEARPYLVPFALAIASSSDLSGVTVTTGPKISSWHNLAFALGSAMTVGSRKFADKALSGVLPPQRMRTPVACAKSRKL